MLRAVSSNEPLLPGRLAPWAAPAATPISGPRDGHRGGHTRTYRHLSPPHVADGGTAAPSRGNANLVRRGAGRRAAASGPCRGRCAAARRGNARPGGACAVRAGRRRGRPARRRAVHGPARAARLSVEHHPGDDPLAEIVVGLAGHGGVGDRRVLAQRRLDLPGADLVAAGLDQIGRAAADEADVAAGAAGRHVAGDEPAVVGQRRGGRVGAVEVAEEQVGTADLDLADRLVVLAGHRGAVVVDQPQLDARQRRPDGPRRGARADTDAGVHQRLGHPVALQHRAAGEPGQPCVLGGRQRRRPGHQ